MKTVYLILLSLLWGMGVQAQDFTLFNVSKLGEHKARLAPKDLPSFPMQGGNNSYQFVDLKGLAIRSQKQVQELFADIDSVQAKALKSVHLQPRFDSQCKIRYYEYLVSFDYLKSLQGMEERLHQYGKLFMQTDLKPEIKIWYPELFKWGAFSFPLVTRVPNKAD